MTVRPFEQRCARRARPGFTLMELLVSLTIATVLLGGIASAIVVAGHALPNRETDATQLAHGSDIADRIAGELFCATVFTERTANSVEFQVADRDGDLTPETIRYAWTGTPGDPLTRQQNSGAIVNLLDALQEFELSYDLKVVTEDPLPPGSESAETLLSSHVASNTGNSFSISSSDWIGQYFAPTLPADALSWRVTRVRFEAKSRGQANGETRIQLRSASASNLPESTIIEEHPMFEADLSNGYQWVEFPYSNVSGLAPGQGLCLVLQHVSGSKSANVRFDNSGSSGCLETNDGGLSWTNWGMRAMNYYVYGTYITDGSGPPLSREWLLSAGIMLRIGSDPVTRVATATRVLNAPEVTAP